MPPIDPDWPPLASYFIVLAGMAVTTWLATRGTRRDVREIKAQTNNDHESNLREDVDKFGESARLAMESSHRTERYVEDLGKSLRAIEHSLDRRTQLLTEDTLPTAVAEALDQHVQTYHQEP